MTNRKLTAEDIRKLVKQVINEGKDASDELKELLPSDDGELVAYATKIDKFLTDIVEEAAALRNEGSELMAKDILGSAKVGERNRFILARVGLVKKLGDLVVQAHENLKRES